MSARASLVLALQALLACPEAPPGVPPYGFASAAEQAFHLELRGTHEVDAQTVVVERFSDVRLRALEREPGKTELELRLDRHFEVVRRKDGSSSELAISADGIVARGGTQGELRLEPSAELSSGISLKEALQAPVAVAFLDPLGAERGVRWHTLEPTLDPVRALDWLLLALPVFAAQGELAVPGRRAVPRLGRYELGLDLELHYAAPVAAVDGAARRFAQTGIVERRGLALTSDLSGDLLLDVQGETELDPTGALRRAELELRMRFTSAEGAPVVSRETLRVRCSACPP